MEKNTLIPKLVRQLLCKVFSADRSGVPGDLLHQVSSDKENHVLARKTMLLDRKNIDFERFFEASTPQTCSGIKRMDMDIIYDISDK